MAEDNTFSNPDHYPLLREFLKRLIRDNPFSRFGVHAVGIGRKRVDGQATDRLALLFYADAKISPIQLTRGRRVPASFRTFSAKQNREVELATDVIESPPPEPFMDLGDEFRPVPGGVSCSSITHIGTGTVGGWVWDNTDDTIVMLSNQHVFGNHVGGAIIQPGTADGGSSPQDRVGRVKRSVSLMLAPAEPTPDDCNLVDAAIGEADDSDLFDLTVVDVGPAVYDTLDPVIGMNVEKTGQTTGHTTGFVTDVDRLRHDPQLPRRTGGALRMLPHRTHRPE